MNLFALRATAKAQKSLNEVQLFLVIWIISFKSVIKSKKIKQKILSSFESFCDLYDTFNWYSNQFHLVLNKAEISYDNTKL